MRLVILSVLLVIVPIFSVAEDKLSVYGCGITRSAFANKLVKAFEQKHGIKTSINKRGGVPVVVKAVMNGKAKVGVGCRVAFKNSTEKNVRSLQVAWGALVFVVNKNNPIKNITIEQAKKVLKGKIRNWKTLGGSDTPINLYLREGRVSGVGFSARALLFKSIKEDFYKKASFRKSSAPIREAVAKDINGFGLDDVTSAVHNKELKMLMVNGIKASRTNILNKSYTIARPFYLYTLGRPTGIARKFLLFTKGKDGQKLIKDLGLINVKEGKGASHLGYLLRLLGV